MNKEKLIAYIIDQLEKDLQTSVDAAQATYEAATHEESKPENEYDTRGLEASYLAGAQAKRAGQIEEALYAFKNTKIKNFTEDDSIAPTALIEVLHNNKKNYVLLMPKGGGQNLNFEGHLIQVITHSSPLGEALLGLYVGDVVNIDIGQITKEYEIISVQ